MKNTSQDRALKNYRKRLTERGLARFEVMGLEADRALIRSLAKLLADDGPEAVRARAALRETLEGEPPKKGGILDALRRSSLIGAGVDLTRRAASPRRVDL